MLKISRQAYYKMKHKEANEYFQEDIILKLVDQIRKKLPRLGGRKLFYLLKEDLNKLPSSPGRDKFFEILGKNGLLLKPVKQYVVTTNSRHRFRIHSNLIKELTIESPNQVFVSDITYIRLERDFSYLFLVTDVYSRKIVGYHLSKDLSAKGAVAAMKMSLKRVSETEGLIHHSDRGIQYCCEEYIGLLEGEKIRISMGEVGNPYDNAIAERVNGILKNEFYLNGKFKNLDYALKATKEAIYNYNNLRPHMSIEYITPEEKYAA